MRDKDGISAALAVLGLAATARSAGASLLDRYDAIEKAHGVHLTAQLTMQTQAAASVMARLRAAPPATLGGAPVTSALDLARRVGRTAARRRARYRLEGARVVMRPSGTEPKIKAYLEVVETGHGRGAHGRARRLPVTGSARCAALSPPCSAAEALP